VTIRVAPPSPRPWPIFLLLRPSVFRGGLGLFLTTFFAASAVTATAAVTILFIDVLQAIVISATIAHVAVAAAPASTAFAVKPVPLTTAGPWGSETPKEVSEFPIKTSIMSFNEYLLPIRQDGKDLLTASRLSQASPTPTN